MNCADNRASPCETLHHMKTKQNKKEHYFYLFWGSDYHGKIFIELFSHSVLFSWNHINIT